MKKVLFALVILTIALSARTAAAERVWFEYGIASMTAGVDVANNKTYVRKYYLAAIGPETLSEAAAEVARKCAAISTESAREAFSAAASPEISVRLAAAVVAFKTSVLGCFKGAAVAQGVADQFRLGLVDRVVTVDGTHIIFDAEHPHARNYREIGKLIEQNVKGDVGKNLNKVMGLYASSQSVSVDIRLPDPSKPVKEASKWAAKLPENGEKLFRDASDAAVKAGKRIAAEAGKALGMTTDAAAAVAKEAGDKLKKQAEKVLRPPEPAQDPVGTGIDVITGGASRFVR